jgi:hypothetical protein
MGLTKTPRRLFPSSISRFLRSNDNSASTALKTTSLSQIDEGSFRSDKTFTMINLKEINESSIDF